MPESAEKDQVVTGGYANVKLTSVPIEDPASISAVTESAVKESIEQWGQNSYYQAFRERQDPRYEAEAPPLLEKEELLPEKLVQLVNTGKKDPEELEEDLAEICDSELLRRLGDEWKIQRHFGPAIAAYSRAITAATATNEGDARLAQLTAMRCHVHRSRKDLKSALADAKKCQHLQQKFGQGYFLEADILVQQGVTGEKLLEVDRLYEKAAELEQDIARRARILDARAEIANKLPWGTDISEAGDASCLLRLVDRGEEKKPYATNLARVAVHWKIREPGETQNTRKYRTSYQENVDLNWEYTKENEKKAPPEWVLAEDDPPFPLLDVVVRKLRPKGQAWLRLTKDSPWFKELPFHDKDVLDVDVLLVGMALACSGPKDKREWDGLETVIDEDKRGAELLERAQMAAKEGKDSMRAAWRGAWRAEARFDRAHNWVAEAFEELAQESQDKASEMGLKSAYGLARSLVLKNQARYAHLAGSAELPFGPPGLASKLRTLGKSSEAEKAEEDLVRASEIGAGAWEWSEGRAPQALVCQALAHFASGDLFGAKAALEKALVADPDYVEAKDLLVRVKASERDAASAVAGEGADALKARLDEGIERKDADCVVLELGKLEEMLPDLTWEKIMALKLGKSIGLVQKNPPSDEAGKLANDLLTKFRQMAMKQGRS